MYSREDKVFVKINKNGYIPFIGMCGPIPNPIKIPTSTCLQMVTAGIDVYEVNPDTKETVKLTVQNVFDDNKFEKKSNLPESLKQPTVYSTDKVIFTGVTQIPEEKKIEDDANNKESNERDGVKKATSVDNENNIKDDEVKSSDDKETDNSKTSSEDGAKNVDQYQQTGNTKTKYKNKNKK